MKLNKIIAGIKQNIATRQRGVHSDIVMVDRRELQILMARFEEMDAELWAIHARKTRVQESSFNAVAGKDAPQQNGGFPTEHCEQVKDAQRNQRDIFQLARAPHWATHILKHIPGEVLFYSNTGDLTAFTKPRLQPLENQPAYSLSGFEFPGPAQNWEVVKPVTPDLYRMLTEQNPERRTEHRKPVTSFDWELQQALIHLQNAISVTDSRRAHLLQAAVQIAKSVRESE